MTKTFAETLGIPGVTVADAVEIIDGLKFTGPVPTIPRDAFLRQRWSEDGTRLMKFREIAYEWSLCLLTVKNQHAAILRRLREHLEGQPPPPHRRCRGLGARRKFPTNQLVGGLQ